MMKELSLLLKVYCLNSFGINKAIHSGKKAKLIGVGLLSLFVSISLLGVSFMYSFMFSYTLSQIDAMYLLIGVMFTASSLVTLFTSIYKINGLLFGFKDYDMIMSLPIKDSTIIKSRLIILYSLNIAFTLLILLPAAVVYGIVEKPEIMFYINFILALFFVPLVPIILATIIGTIIAYISSKFRKNNIISLILMLLFFFAVMIVSFNMQTVITDFANIGTTIMNVVNRSYPLAKLYVDAVCNYNILSLILFITISIALYMLYASIVGRYFKKMNTSITTSKARSNFKFNETKVTTPFKALYQKELRRFFSSSLYVLNTGVGMLLLVIFSVAMLFMGPEKLGAFLELPFTSVINTILPLFISFFVVMSCPASCSISLEGKNLWIIKSIPINPITILISKVALNLTITLPLATISSILISFIFKLNALESLFAVIIPISFCIFISFVGVIVNLYFPNFTWNTEVTVIKQSAAVIIAMLLGFAAIILCGVILFAIKSINALLATFIIALLMIIIDYALYLLLKTKGVKLFNEL